MPNRGRVDLAGLDPESVSGYNCYSLKFQPFSLILQLNTPFSIPRLYADSEYNALTAYSAPEIQRVPLDNLILQMISMGLPDARKFPFIEPPPPESIENSIIVLKEQGALYENESLTVVGKR